MRRQLTVGAGLAVTSLIRPWSLRGDARSFSRVRTVEIRIQNVWEWATSTSACLFNVRSPKHRQTDRQTDRQTVVLLSAAISPVLLHSKLFKCSQQLSHSHFFSTFAGSDCMERSFDADLIHRGSSINEPVVRFLSLPHKKRFPTPELVTMLSKNACWKDQGHYFLHFSKAQALSEFRLSATCFWRDTETSFIAQIPPLHLLISELLWAEMILLEAVSIPAARSRMNTSQLIWTKHVRWYDSEPRNRLRPHYTSWEELPRMLRTGHLGVDKKSTGEYLFLLSGDCMNMSKINTASFWVHRSVLEQSSTMLVVAFDFLLSFCVRTSPLRVSQACVPSFSPNNIQLACIQCV